MFLSCAISEMQQDVGRKSPITKAVHHSVMMAVRFEPESGLTTLRHATTKPLRSVM